MTSDPERLAAHQGEHTRRRAALALACLAGIIAFTVQARWVRQYQGASVPFGDEWQGLIGFLAAVRAGHLDWHLMFEPHNDHRIPVARAFFLVTYWVVGESSFLACLLISAALMGAIVAIWVYTLRRLGEPIAVIAATVFVLMSPSQYHNILWGFQIEFYTLVGSVVAAICWIALTPRISWSGVAGCAAACAISLYSIISGVLSWAVVGPVLLLRAVTEHRSVRALLGARREWLQMGLFVVLGLVVTGAYFYHYDAQHSQEGAPRSAMQFVTWFSASIVYPIVDISKPSQVWWLPAVVAAVFVPIAAALWLYWVRRDRARLVLVAGLVLNVVLNMGVIAAGRAASRFIAPRYGTVALWSSAVSLLALASLWRATIRTRWRWAAAPLLLALAGYLLYVHAWRYQTYTTEMAQIRRNYIAFEQNLRAYVTDASPRRRLAGFLPFPSVIIAPYMNDPESMAVMPYNLRPPARFAVAGEAWAIDRLPPALPAPPDTFVFGSGAGADGRTGTLTSTAFRPRGSLVLEVAGYPTRAGDSLAVESVDDSTRRVIFDGPDPGMAWAEWRIGPADLPGPRIRIVAVDGAADSQGWLAVAVPADKPRAAGRLESFLAHVEWWMAGPAAAMLLLLWGYRRSKTSTDSPAG